jgi:hypothetical protein
MIMQESFWTELQITDDNLDALYNFLLESETPATKSELLKKLIINLISEQKTIIENNRKLEGATYFPKNKYEIGQNLVFPQRSWQKGKIVNKRPGVNPEITGLEVIEVEFANSERSKFASNLASHKLNNPTVETFGDLLDTKFVAAGFGDQISSKLQEKLDSNEDLVCIAGKYFPRALLVDVSVGHLNLCEAVLEIENGGPLTTQDLITQIDLPTDVNNHLTEFSLNLALQEDTRFDEVGPAGETLWFLNRLEPAEVQNTPYTLKYTREIFSLPEELLQYSSFGSEICDELEPEESTSTEDSVTLSLIYPHWRAGTLPLTPKLKMLFPTAYETPRIKFDFFDVDQNFTFSGWVVRPSKYIYGLREWYLREGFIPGSILRISKSKISGQVNIQADKQRNRKEWIRTVLVGADGGVVIALLKQVVACSFDERMALVTPDVKALDAVWEKKSHLPLEKIIQLVMIELAKLNPQGHIHAQELYAAVNVVQRCPPSVILSTIFSQPWSTHMGDLYFRLNN